MNYKIYDIQSLTMRHIKSELYIHDANDIIVEILNELSRTRLAKIFKCGWNSSRFLSKVHFTCIKFIILLWHNTVQNYTMVKNLTKSPKYSPRINLRSDRNSSRLFHVNLSKVHFTCIKFITLLWHMAVKNHMMHGYFDKRPKVKTFVSISN